MKENAWPERSQHVRGPSGRCGFVNIAGLRNQDLLAPAVIRRRAVPRCVVVRCADQTMIRRQCLRPENLPGRGRISIHAGADCWVLTKQARPSFLQKRSKKLLIPAQVKLLRIAGCTRTPQMRGDKSFLVLFFKKGLLACYVPHLQRYVASRHRCAPAGRRTHARLCATAVTNRNPWGSPYPVTSSQPSGTSSDVSVPKLTAGSSSPGA